MTDADTTRARFAATASRMAAFGDTRVERIRAQLSALLELSGTERALDVGTGTGPLAFALAPLVNEVIGLDPVPEMLAEARRRAAKFENVSFVAGFGDRLPFGDATFDVTMCGRTLHHVDRPVALVAEMARVTRISGHVVVLDQVAPEDAGVASLQEQIERLRDPSHVRTLSDGELRGLLGAAGLVVERVEIEREERDLEGFLALAGCEGDGRRRVLEFVEETVAAGRGGGIGLRREPTGFRFTILVGWYVARHPGPAFSGTA